MKFLASSPPVPRAILRLDLHPCYERGMKYDTKSDVKDMNFGHAWVFGHPICFGNIDDGFWWSEMFKLRPWRWGGGRGSVQWGRRGVLAALLNNHDQRSNAERAAKQEAPERQ